MSERTMPSRDQTPTAAEDPRPVVVGVDGSANAESAAVWAVDGLIAHSTTPVAAVPID